MRKILTILFLLLGIASRGQFDTVSVRQQIQAYGYDYKNIKIRQSFLPPKDTFYLRLSDTGAIAVLNGKLYIWKLISGTKKWDELSAGAGGGVADNWGSQVAVVGDGILGDGTAGNPLIADTSFLGPLWRSQITTPNLIVQNIGTGIQSWYTSGDTLYKKMFGNSLGLNSSTGSDSTFYYTIDSAIWVHKSSTGQITGAKTFTQDVTIQQNGDPPYLALNRTGTTTNENIGGIVFKDNATIRMYSFLGNFGDTGWVLTQGNGVGTKSWKTEDKFGHMSLGFSTFTRGWAIDVSHSTSNYGIDSSLIQGFLRHRWINAGSNVVDSFKVDRGANLFSSGNITAEIDSTGTARNMLYQGANGMIYRAAVPAGGGSSYTFSDGVFESAGAVKVDTFLVSTRAQTTKRIDSLALMIGGGGVAWGGITGTLSSQTDLYNALNSRAALNKVVTALGSTGKWVTFGRDRSQMQQTATLSDGQIRWAAIPVGEAGTITGVKFYQVTQGNFVGDNKNAISLWTYSGGNMTKVAETANTEAIWENTANTFVDVAFSSTYSAAAGVYFIGYIYNNSSQTTAPAIGAFPTMFASGINDYTNSAKLMSFLSTQTDFTSPQAMSATTSNTVPIYFELY